MSLTAERPLIRRRPLRVWPGLATVALVVLLSTVSWVAPASEVFGFPVGLLGLLSRVAGGLLVIVWWLFFSRALWIERIGALVMMAAALILTRPFLHESIAGAGMGLLFPIYALPIMSLAVVLWAAASRRSSGARRLAVMAGLVLLGSGMWTLVRTGGVSGGGSSDLHWRWTPTPEERLLAQGPLVPDDGARAPASDAGPAPGAASPSVPPELATSGPRTGEPTREAAAPAAAAASGAGPKSETPTTALESREPRRADPVVAPASWPGFRGPRRDGVVRDLRIDTDWSRTPPVEIWRRPVGPGWSSFAVAGDLVYTQEQRGDHEIVSAYRLATGEPVWVHRNPVRFYESNAGPGPRATPAVHDGRVYAVGATGILDALNAATGAVRWTRDAAADTGKEIPDWGIAGSPVVAGDRVIVAIAGRPAAYDAASGELRWVGPEGGGGYSSPQVAVIDGVEQVLLQRGARTISVSPEDGGVLWDHTWERGGSIVQPAMLGNDVLIAATDPAGMGGLGIRRLAVRHDGGAWTVEERWTSRALKPYFNDFVVHDGHAYGFDGGILACMDLADGARKWKGGRYGHGQLVLLPDRDVLLVLAEEGYIALVRAAPAGFEEVARVPAIEGKTWNHPVIAGGILLVRNGEEMAAFRLPVTNP